MAEGLTRRIFVEMLREEWRLHGRLFGGRRFLAFPFLVGLLVAGSVVLLGVTDTPTGVVVGGLHALAFLFGLHTGSVGLVGRDALEDLLGDLTLLVFSAKTLPLSPRRLLGVFVAKDVVYYAGLFLLPMALGALPALGGATAAGIGGAVLLWLTLAGTFVLGVVATLALAGLAGRGVPGAVLLAAAVGAGALAWIAGLDVVAWTPYGVFEAVRAGGPIGVVLARLGASTAAVGLLGGVGAATFELGEDRTTRTAGPALRRWRDRVGDPVAAKTLLDLSRSSGGYGKVLFSTGILFLVTVALVDLAQAITGVEPSVGIGFGTVLGLSGFTTYNWLTRFDDAEAYLVQPLDVRDLFAGKLRAFLLTGPTAALAFYAAAWAWKGTPLVEGLTGALLAVGVATYVFGVTAFLAGFSPNEFLFDTALFAAFTVAVAVPLVPILVVGFGYAPLSAGQVLPLAGGAVLMAFVGWGLYRLAVPRWTRYLRS